MLFLFSAEEVFGYQQSDLMPEELVVFDAYQTVYAWVGKMYMQKDPKVVLNIVEEYLVMGKDVRMLKTKSGCVLQKKLFKIFVTYRQIDLFLVEKCGPRHLLPFLRTSYSLLSFGQ